MDRTTAIRLTALFALVVAVLACGTTPTPAPPTTRPTAHAGTTPAPRATTGATPVPSPDPSASDEDDPAIGAEAEPLLAMLPHSWRASCFGGPSFIDGAVAYLSCHSPARGIDDVELVGYDAASDAGSADGYYGDNFWAYGDPVCDATRVDGDLVVGGRTIGTAGGCRHQKWLAFVLDDDHVAGRIDAMSFKAASSAFVRLRPFPDTYRGDVSGPAFVPLASLADLRASARTPSYATLVHNNRSLQGKRVYIEGEVQQYTKDPDAPFTVLIWTKKQGGVYLGGPIGLDGYSGRALAVGDKLEVVGRVDAMVTYQSIGGSRTIPTIDVERTHIGS